MRYENQKTELFDILQQLIAIPSFTNNLAMSQEVIDLAANYLAEYGLHIKKITKNGFPSLVATTRKTKHPKLLLQAHVDVVPCGLSQLELVKADGNLYGRGVFDMKFGAACFLLAVKQLKDQLGDLDFGIMLTTDEESGGENGVGYLTSIGYSADCVFLPDGGANWQVEIAARGSWSFQATASGKSAHSSRPWLGENAIDKLIDFINQVKSIIPSSQEGDSTLVTSQISGGEAINQVPDQAMVTFNVRYESDQQVAGFKSQIAQLASRSGIEIEQLMNIQPRQLDTDSPVLDIWNQTVSEVRNDNSEPQYAKSFGASDARYFGDTPVIVVSPAGGGAHSEQEWISQDQLYEFHDCVVNFITQIA